MALNEFLAKEVSAWLLEPVALFLRPRSAGLISLTIFLLGLFPILFPNHLLKADGTLLSIMGSVMAIFGFDEILVSMGKPSFFLLTLDWINRFPLPKFNKEPKIISLSATGTSNSMGSANLQVLLKRPDPSEPLERHIEWLKYELDRQDEQIRRLRQDFEKEKTRLSGKIDSERQERVSNHKYLDQKLVDVVAGGIPINLLGLFCIILGIVLLSFNH